MSMSQWPNNAKHVLLGVPEAMRTGMRRLSPTFLAPVTFSALATVSSTKKGAVRAKRQETSTSMRALEVRDGANRDDSSEGFR